MFLLLLSDCCPCCRSFQSAVIKRSPNDQSHWLLTRDVIILMASPTRSQHRTRVLWHVFLRLIARNDQNPL